MIVPGGGFLLPSSPVQGVCPGRGMVFDEIDTCIISSPYCDSLFCPEGKVLYTIIVLGGGFFAPFISYPGGLSLEEGGGWFWMKLIPALYHHHTV